MLGFLGCSHMNEFHKLFSIPKIHLIQIAEEEAPPPQYDESMTLASNVVPRNNTSSSVPPTSATPAVPMPTSASQ